ncbi:MAG: SMP-30/gluconolactonase/LRE family protein [Chloroflexota bacterium]
MSQQQADDQSGLIMYLSRQSLPIRLTAFFVFIILIVGVIVGITGGLYYANVANFPRLMPIGVAEGTSAEEFAVFTDDEAYPAAVTSSEDGTLYTGSFAHGTVWRVNPAGTIAELPDTRSLIGSVIGLDVASDGTLYILDHVEALTASGAKVWRLPLDGDLELIFEGDSSLISNPNDIAVDTSGRVYISDIGGGQILRINGTETSIWWSAPNETYLISGLAYNPLNDTLLVTDANQITVYEIPVSAENPETARQTIFTLMDSSVDAPFFNGVDIADDGTVYVAALDANEIWRIDGADAYTIIAGNYRGSSDVAYDSANNRLYVNNWDQSWLSPIPIFVIEVKFAPRLPFSVDVVNLGS